MTQLALGWQKEAPAGEIERLNSMLAALAPPSDQHPYLWSYWEPGDEWSPLERIVIARMEPRKLFVAQDRFYRAMGEGSDASTLAELDGPSPRWGGHYDQALGRYVHAEWRLPPTITERQWLLWRQLGALATPVWIVQGDAGGTPRRFNAWEREWARVTRQPTKPPAPGALDYAPADNRVLAALLERRRTDVLAHDVSEGWMQKDEREMTDAELMLHREFGRWYERRNEERAHGLVKDVAYNPTTERFDVVDYTRIR